MKLINQNIFGAFIVACLICLVSGCASFPKESIARSATDHNLAVEKAQNEMLLLNIVRASMRRPMYFTSLGTLRGGMTFNLQSGSLNIPFANAGGNGTYSIAPSVSQSISPNYDITVQDTQEFMRGIMTPVSLETMAYYWNQGWPEEMLLHLFVRSIELKNKDGVVRSYVNYPGRDPKAEDIAEQQTEGIKMLPIDFHPFIDGCKLASKKVVNQIGLIDKDSAGNLKRLIEMHNAKLTLEGDEGGHHYSLVEEKTSYYLDCGVDGKAVAPNEKKDGEFEGKVYMRSPEAIIYYLGELARRTIENPQSKHIFNSCKHKKNSIAAATLFSVQKFSSDSDFAVAVEYEGDKYVINKSKEEDPCKLDRSMHVLSLVSQLISLQKSAKDMPVTGVVEVIGR